MKALKLTFYIFLGIYVVLFLSTRQPENAINDFSEFFLTPFILMAYLPFVREILSTLGLFDTGFMPWPKPMAYIILIPITFGLIYCIAWVITAKPKK